MVAAVTRNPVVPSLSNAFSMWIFSHTGINAVNIDMALEAKKNGMKVIVYGSAAATGDKPGRHSSKKNLFQLADVIVDSCVPLQDASVPMKNHLDKIGPLSTLGFVTMVGEANVP